MPWMGRFDLIPLSLLLLCVPAQYFISTQWGSTLPDSERVEVLQRLVIKMRSIAEDYLSVPFWRDFAWEVREEVVAIWKDVDHPLAADRPQPMSPDVIGESAAMEILQFRIDQGYFASSKQSRFPKTDDVRFCVGQMVRHKLLGYRGVIVGWDPVAKAPESWLATMHPADKTHWRSMPNYAILVDTHDRSEPQMTYVPQENLEVLTRVEIRHPDKEDYFMAYTGDIYIPQPWLREIYPAD